MRKMAISTGKPWLPLNKDARVRNVRLQEGEMGSLLNLYRNLIKIHRSSEALQKGSWIPVINGQKGVLAYFRLTEEERILVILNFTGRRKTVSLPEHSCGKVLLSTHRSIEEYCYFQNLHIGPFEASIFVVLLL